MTRNADTATPAVPAVDRGGQYSAAFRPDIEGLRAVAVLLVVLYHSSVPGFSGGYVGVDVFFVISGYLITGTLVREAAATSTVRLFRFWGRRVRRLVPALSVMVVSTWIAGLLIQSPLGWEHLAKEGMSAATYTSNIRFAQEGGGYFANAESPFLHTWSLSVEEQFYIGWPILVLVAIKLPGRGSSWARWKLAGLIAAVTVVSFAMCVLATRRGTSWAYFSAPTRAWEFGLGALLALAGGNLAARGGRMSARAVFAGLAAILFASNQFDNVTKFPGLFAAVPVVGTVLVLAGGAQRASGLSSRLLGIPVLQVLGRLSYSWYLWHWPFLVMGARLIGPLSTPTKVGVSTLALGVAALTNILVENPLRYAAWLRRPVRSLTAGAVSVAILVGCGVGITVATDRAIADPYLAALVAAREGRAIGGPSNLCSAASFDGEKYCTYGPKDATRLVMLVGDSHASQWGSAVIEAAASNDARVLIRVHGGCPAVDVPVRSIGEAGVSAACEQFRADTQRLIAAVHPDLVVMSNADYTKRLLDSDSDGLLSPENAIQLWAEAVGTYAKTLREDEVPLVVIGNNPSIPRDPIECLARHRDGERCAEKSGPLLAELALVMGPEREALERAGVAGVLEVAPLICDETRCRVEDESGPIYSDESHLSESFVLSMTGRVNELVSSGFTDGAE